MKITRRRFLGTTASAIIVGGMKAQGRVWGANDRIGVCTIGFNGRGMVHINGILAQKGEAEYVALCDVDANVLARGGKTVDAAQGRVPKLYKDLRDALQDKNVDAVTIATPNHWHALATIWACQAGKDVYVEKPLSHNIDEGRQVVAAAEKYGRIVHHGTQARTLSSALVRDMQLIHDGFIGRIVESRGYVYKISNRRAIGHGKPGPVPSYLDWRLWQGPARDQEYMINAEREKPGLYTHYDWHWFWEYGNGEIGNQGVHEIDIACWGHDRGLPVNVYSSGGRHGWEDSGQTPNTQATIYSYSDGSIMTFHVRNLGSYQDADGGECGNSFFGTKGMYVRGKGFFSYKPGSMSQREKIPVPADVPVPKSRGMWQPFFQALRSRNPQDMSVSTLDAHIACVHCHLGNISYRLGRSLEFDPETERFKDREANRYLTREYRRGFEVSRLT